MRQGLPAFLKKVLSKARFTAFTTNCSKWLYKDLDAGAMPVRPEVPLDVRLLKEDLGVLAAWMKERHREFPWMYFSRELRAAKEFGHVYACMMRGTEIIGYIKIGMDKVYINDFERLVELPRREAMLYDIFVLPEYRGKKAASYALSMTLDYLKDAGFQRLWCHVEKWNAPSLNTFFKAGFRESASIRFVRVLNLSFFLKNGYVPLRLMDFFKGARPLKKLSVPLTHFPERS